MNTVSSSKSISKHSQSLTGLMSLLILFALNPSSVQASELQKLASIIKPSSIEKDYSKVMNLAKDAFFNEGEKINEVRMKGSLEYVVTGTLKSGSQCRISVSHACTEGYWASLPVDECRFLRTAKEWFISTVSCD